MYHKKKSKKNNHMMMIILHIMMRILKKVVFIALIKGTTHRMHNIFLKNFNLEIAIKTLIKI